MNTTARSRKGAHLSATEEPDHSCDSEQAGEIAQGSNRNLRAKQVNISLQLGRYLINAMGKHTLINVQSVVLKAQRCVHLFL